MSDITRYDPLVESVSAVVRCGANPGGQYVKYEDHVAEVERFRAEVEALRADAGRITCGGTPSPNQPCVCGRCVL